ncbi:MAG: hypothetical protein IJU03_01070 [Thermoguttaceae bacterium]|nr:hypothetical protein [Thermoguttaceae bacterium]
MQYEITISGSFENHVFVNMAYEDAEVTAIQLSDGLKKALVADGFENVEINYDFEAVEDSRRE